MDTPFVETLLVLPERKPHEFEADSPGVVGVCFERLSLSLSLPLVALQIDDTFP